MAEVRSTPKSVRNGVDDRRGTGEAVTREQSLRAMTINIARQFRQEQKKIFRVSLAILISVLKLAVFKYLRSISSFSAGVL